MERTGKTEAMVRLHLKKAGHDLGWKAGDYHAMGLQSLVVACQWLSNLPDKGDEGQSNLL
jgi:hypothetical protein